MKALGLDRSMRVRKRSEYLAAQTRGRKVSGALFIMLLLRSSAARLGITVSSRVGNAVVRARLRRWVREFVRQHKTLLLAGHDHVVVARSQAAAASHREVDGELANLFKRAHKVSA